MEQLRIQERNKIYNDIKNLDVIISRNIETIKRFLSKSSQTVFDKKQVSEREKQNDINNNNLKLLKERLVSLNSGLLDNELKDNSNVITNKLIEQNKLVQDKQIKKIEDKQKKKDDQELQYKNKNREPSDKYLEKQMKYELKNFFTLSKYIPDYIKRNLAEMPNNKGYIVKNKYIDMWCLGELPAEPNKPLILFEKQKDTMFITEIDNNFTYVYEKKGTGKRILISKTPKIRLS